MSQYENNISLWSEKLRENIELLLNAGKKVYIIALSRKMPRFFDWLCSCDFSEEATKLKQTLSKSNVFMTTEYAIPLIAAGATSEEISSTEGIIVDDALLFGATANRVCMQWYAVFGKKPYLSAVFRSKEGMISSHFEPYSSPFLSRISLKDMVSPLRFISEKILSSSLPVDMEYPIIHIKSDFETVKAHIKENLPSGWITYDVESRIGETKRNSFSAILEDEKASGYNNDFAKIRLFPKNDGCCMEIIAPNAVCVEELENGKFFRNPIYAEAWTGVSNAISSVSAKNIDSDDDGILSHNQYYTALLKVFTLTVWINYLLSLSSFSRHFDMLIPKDTAVEIRRDDLNLILSEEYSGRMLHVVNSIVSGKAISENPHQRVTLPIYVNPDEVRDLYSNFVAAALAPDADVEKNLDNIFAQSHFCSPLADEVRKRIILGHNIIGETFESLFIHLQNFHKKDNDMEIKVNRWIDARIDESRIAPKYEMVRGSDNKTYLRRFFLSGSNSIKE